MATSERDLYTDISSQYDALTEVPLAKIEREMVEYSLGDCTGKTVIDLGGGTGLKARTAVDHGAKLIDVVDVSSGMLQDGQTAGEKLGRKDPIRWHVGDVTASLDHLPLEKAYDIAIIGWTFDHAENMDQLEGMWRNTALFLKPGGKLINIRMKDPYAASGQSKYGITFSDFKDVPGGVLYKYTVLTTPPFTCPASSMDASLDLEQSKAIAERHGFQDFMKAPAEEMECAKSDPEFWQEYLDDPFFVCITATKKA